MKIRIKKKEGVLFWITGFSGSGKSSLGKGIKKDIEKKFGKTILIHGDNIRKIFKLKNYEKNKRLEIGYMYVDLIKLLIKQKINVIFTVVGLFKKLRNKNQKVFKNYIEIYIQANILDIIKNKKKIIYNKKKNIWGVDLEPELPINPTIIIKNNFKKNIKTLSEELYNKINSKVHIA
jgi:adenylylsulfate kinase-like enzyme